MRTFADPIFKYQLYNKRTVLQRVSNHVGETPKRYPRIDHINK